MVRSRLVSDYTFQLVFITDRLQPHSTVYRRRPSFSSRRCSCLVGTVFLNTSAPSVAVFRSRPQKTHPLVSNPYVQCPRSDAHVTMDTLIVSVTYLLTYSNGCAGSADDAMCRHYGRVLLPAQIYGGCGRGNASIA